MLYTKNIEKLEHFDVWLQAEAVVDTCMGDVTKKWNKSYDKTHLICDIPFGTKNLNKQKF